MADDRPFVSQETLDLWLAEGRIAVDGDVMTLPGGRRFTLLTAVHFTSDVTETNDPHGLIGKVKDVDTLSDMGGEHVSDSVILGDTAYEVIEGFLGQPSEDVVDAIELPPGEGTLAQLSRFFVETA